MPAKGVTEDLNGRRLAGLFGLNDGKNQTQSLPQSDSAASLTTVSNSSGVDEPGVLQTALSLPAERKRSRWYEEDQPKLAVEVNSFRVQVVQR